jgi:large subunit ribosomal protein L32e
MSKRFVRPDTHLIPRIGKSRPKMQTWRRPRGKQNKTRLKRFGYPIQPEIGFGTPKSRAGKINGLIPMNINSVSDIDSISKENIAIISRRFGAKKKIGIIKTLNEKGIIILNAGGKK